MLQKYLHDGMLAALIISLLDKLAHPQTISEVARNVFMGNVSDERISDLIVKWMKTGNIEISNPHLIELLQRYQGSRLSIISNIVKQFLAFKCLAPASIQSDNPLIALLNSNADPTWVVFMLRCGILNNPKDLLIQGIR